VASRSRGLKTQFFCCGHVRDSLAAWFVIRFGMASTADSLPTDLAAAHAMIIAQRESVAVAEAKAAVAESVAKSRALEIEQLRYQIAKLKHEQYGQSSERSAVLEQLRRSGSLRRRSSRAWLPPRWHERRGFTQASCSDGENTDGVAAASQSSCRWRPRHQGRAARRHRVGLSM
jgi:hypothetical protein